MSFQSGIAMEYTQDLHLKMSKKIAQLTKVSSVFMGPKPTLGLDPYTPALMWEMSTKLCSEFYLFNSLLVIVKHSFMPLQNLFHWEKKESLGAFGIHIT